MIEADKDYELKVLKTAIYAYLNESLPLTDKSIDRLENNLVSVVWDVATTIYRQSGHKVEFSMVRDIANSQIVLMKHQLAEEKEKEKKRIAEMQRQLAEKERQERPLAEERARQERLLTEKKARQERLLVEERKSNKYYSVMSCQTSSKPLTPIKRAQSVPVAATLVVQQPPPNHHFPQKLLFFSSRIST
jgi:hypothetical protein